MKQPLLLVERSHTAPCSCLRTFSAPNSGLKRTTPRRQIFDDVWQQFTKLSGPVGSSALDDVFNRMSAGKDEFETPQAAVTKVLVAGATGRCARAARLLWRKLGSSNGACGSAGRLHIWLGIYLTGLQAA